MEPQCAAGDNALALCSLYYTRQAVAIAQRQLSTAESELAAIEVAAAVASYYGDKATFSPALAGRLRFFVHMFVVPAAILLLGRRRLPTH